MIDFMLEAIKEAQKAMKKGEVPIGAVIVKDGKIIGRGRNKREKKQNALAHAEIVAIHKACKKLDSWRLDGADIYVTLEPCPMCAGAIANARISRIIYATGDTTAKDNLCEKICESVRLNHKVTLEKGRYAKTSKLLLQDFFKEKRSKKEAI